MICTGQVIVFHEPSEYARRISCCNQPDYAACSRIINCDCSALSKKLWAYRRGQLRRPVDAARTRRETVGCARPGGSHGLAGPATSPGETSPVPRPPKTVDAPSPWTLRTRLTDRCHSDLDDDQCAWTATAACHNLGIDDAFFTRLSGTLWRLCQRAPRQCYAASRCPPHPAATEGPLVCSTSPGGDAAPLRFDCRCSLPTPHVGCGAHGAAAWRLCLHAACFRWLYRCDALSVFYT